MTKLPDFDAALARQGTAPRARRRTSAVAAPGRCDKCPSSSCARPRRRRALSNTTGQCPTRRPGYTGWVRSVLWAGALVGCSPKAPIPATRPQPEALDGPAAADSCTLTASGRLTVPASRSEPPIRETAAGLTAQPPGFEQPRTVSHEAMVAIARREALRLLKLQFDGRVGEVTEKVGRETRIRTLSVGYLLRCLGHHRRDPRRRTIRRDRLVEHRRRAVRTGWSIRASMLVHSVWPAPPRWWLG